MNEIMVKVTSNGIETYESLDTYCKRISKKNNSILYKLEHYLNKKMLEDDELMGIRDIILTVSADVSKISSIVVVGDSYEKLQ